jgi:hypothetical protein
VRKTLLLLAIAVAFLTTGCIQADLKLEVNDDGSGTYSAVFAVNSQLMQTMGGLSAINPDADIAKSSGDVCKDMVTESQEDVPKGGKVEPYKNGDFCGVKMTGSFSNIEEGIELLSGETGFATLEDVTLEKQGSAWVFDAQWNPNAAGVGAGSADDQMTKQFMQGFSFVVRMKLPGGQVDQNADLIDGDGTMVWNLDPTAGRTLKARTEPGATVIKSKVQTDAGKNVNASAASAAGSGDDGGSSKTWLYVVIGLVVVAIIVAIVLMKRNKPKAVPAMAGMPSSMGPGAPLGSPMSTPSAASMSAPSGVAEAAAPAAVGASPKAATEPQWDAARNAYIQWDNVNNRWMQYDQAAATWKPIE